MLRSLWDEPTEAEPPRIAPALTMRPPVVSGADFVAAEMEAGTQPAWDVEPAPPPAHSSRPRALPAWLLLVKDALRRQLTEAFDPSLLAELDEDAARDLVRRAAIEVLDEQHVQGVGAYRNALLEGLVEDVLGLGPLEPLLRDDSVSEIMVNGPRSIFVERAGQVHRTHYTFRDEEHLARIVDRIVSPLGRHVDEASPMADARLADGSRVNIIAPPASPTGIMLTLRKFERTRLRADDLVQCGTLSAEALAFLRAAVQSKLNILVSGGAGSGKTTLLNVLSSFIGQNERIVTIEDPLELQLQQPHVVPLEARPGGLDGGKPITQRELVRNALRMRPDRIVVGEVRGGEAFDMLQAMNTGHDGSLSTVHANTARDALARVENMVLMAGFDLPAAAVREQVGSAVHLIVQIDRMADGSRRVTQIAEVVGMEQGMVTLQDVFRLEGMARDEDGRVTGRLTWTGVPPRFAERFRQHGAAEAWGRFVARA